MRRRGRRGCPIGPGARCAPGLRSDRESDSGASGPTAAEARHDGHDSGRDGPAGQGTHRSTARADAGHGHGLAAARTVGRRGLVIVLGVTAAFMVAELVGGLLSNSLALLADAGHMLTDVAALGLSLFALWFAQRPAPQEKTYGYLRIEILAALVNGVTLTVIALAIFYEAYQRMLAPTEIRSGLMLAVALAGLGVNIFAARVLHGGAGHSLNIRGAYLHVLGDLLGSLGAVAAAIVIAVTGWTLADPLISVLVGVLILVSSWQLVRESVDVLLESVPAHIDMTELRNAIDEIPGVDEIHDLHVWTLTSGFIAMSGHAVVRDPGDHQQILGEIHHRMRERFDIRHVTVQLEREALYATEAHL